MILWFGNVITYHCRWGWTFSECPPVCVWRLEINRVSVKCRVQVGRWVKCGTRSAGALHFPQPSGSLGKMQVWNSTLKCRLGIVQWHFMFDCLQSVIIHFRVLFIYCLHSVARWIAMKYNSTHREIKTITWLYFRVNILVGSWLEIGINWKINFSDKLSKFNPL